MARGPLSRHQQASSSRPTCLCRTHLSLGEKIVDISLLNEYGSNHVPSGRDEIWRPEGLLLTWGRQWAHLLASVLSIRQRQFCEVSCMRVRTVAHDPCKLESAGQAQLDCSQYDRNELYRDEAVRLVVANHPAGDLI